MKPSVIVWDLETVPDLCGFAAANDLVGKRDADIREALGNQFPKHIYHSIVCIGALVAHRESDHWAIEALGAPHVGERIEKQTQVRLRPSATYVPRALRSASLSRAARNAFRSLSFIAITGELGFTSATLLPTMLSS